MQFRWNRIETWLVLALGGAGLIVLGVAGLWMYISATATPLHPNASDVPSVAGSNAAAKWSAAIDLARQAVKPIVAEQNLPGVSIAIGIGGEIVWAEGFGFADIEKKTPVTPATQFRIGTASTVLTSAAVGLLLEQGVLTLDETIQKHVPEYPEQQWPVTLRQVMGNLAGLPNDGGDESELFARHCDRPVDAIQYFGQRSLRFEPGTAYRYSNYGSILVSAAVEAAADEAFLTLMRKRIFEPLGMAHTEPDLAAESGPDQATAYFPRFAADPRYGPDLMRDLDLSCYSGSSVFLSTASDLVTFGMAINAGTLLQPATVQLLQTSQKLGSGEETGYGLGWDLETVTIGGQQVRTVGHDGDVLGGTVGSLMTLPDRGMVIAVISNTSYAGTPGIAVKIAEAFGKR